MNNFKLAKNYFIIGTKRVAEYRMLLVTELLGDLVYILLAYFAWAFLLGLGYKTLGGFTKSDFLVYFILSILIVCFFSRIAQRFAEDVNSGYLLLFLTRGINPFIVYYFSQIGTIIWEIVMLIILLIIAASISGTITLAGSLLFILFLIFAIILETISFSIIGLFAIKTKKIEGIVNIGYTVIGILSGAWIPLNIFPTIFQKISYFLPFQYTRYFPATVFMGKPTTIQILYGLMSSIIWIIIFYLLFRILYKRAIKNFESQGG